MYKNSLVLNCNKKQERLNDLAGNATVFASYLMDMLRHFYPDIYKKLSNDKYVDRLKREIKEYKDVLYSTEGI